MTFEPKTHQAEEILTLDDVANLLKVPVATLRKWRVARTGPAAFRLGKYVRYKRSSIDQFIAEQEAKEDQ